MTTRGIRAFDRGYWECLAKRHITDAEFRAAMNAVLSDRFADRRKKKRAGLKAIRDLIQK
jgi:hypothetical protein